MGFADMNSEDGERHLRTARGCSDCVEMGRKVAEEDPQPPDNRRDRCHRSSHRDFRERMRRKDTVRTSAMRSAAMMMLIFVVVDVWALAPSCSPGSASDEICRKTVLTFDICAVFLLCRALVCIFGDEGIVRWNECSRNSKGKWSSGWDSCRH